MAISEVGTHQSAGYGTAISDTHGVSILSGDVVVCFIRMINAFTTSDNNGANAFTDGLVNQDAIGTSNHYSIYYRVAGASEPAAYAFTITGGNTNWGICTRVFRGVDTASPWNILAGNGYASASRNGTTCPAASITTTVDGCLALVYYFCNLNTVSWSSVDNSFAGGLTLNNNYASYAVYTKSITSAGAVGITTATFTPTMNDWTGAGIIALQPAVTPFTGLTVTKLLQG